MSSLSVCAIKGFCFTISCVQEVQLFDGKIKLRERAKVCAPLPITPSICSYTHLLVFAEKRLLFSEDFPPDFGA